MTVRKNLLRKYVYADRILIFLLLFFFIFFANYVHNSKVANESRSRDFAFNAWQLVTKDSNIFNLVKTKDAMISSSSNDAFETNAGSFYWNTGIRLSYLFNSSIIWPEYAKCPTVSSACPLPDVRARVIRTVPNLQRGTFVPVGRNLRNLDDWVNMNSVPGALEGIHIWWFDIYLMTPKTMVALIAPFDESVATASVKFKDLRFVTISSAPKLEFSPSLSNVCLIRDSQASGDTVRANGLTLTYWKVPISGKTPTRQPAVIPSVMDIRGLAAGSC